MEGFDDLLGPSRRALEDNPFSDPFGNRSSSPDPWSSPFAAQETDIYHQPFASTATDTTVSEKSPTASDDEAEKTPHLQKEAALEEPSDPLDSAAANIPDPEEEERPALPPQRNSTTPSASVVSSSLTPGFREDISKAEPEPAVQEHQHAFFSETATIRPTEPEETIARHTAASSSRESSPQRKPQIAHAKSPSWAPLNGGGATERGFGTGLALGGETTNDGWRTETEGWGNDRTSLSFVQQVDADEDSDDDKPIGTLRSPGKGEKKPQEERPVFNITVDDPQKVGDPIRGFTMYTVHTHTTSPLFAKPTFSVLRRYSDFLWIYEALNINNPGVVVPPVPEKNPFGRFDDQFVKQRRLGLEKCIQKISNHPILGKDPDLKIFLESDTFALDIKHRKAELAHERGGLMASIGQTLTGPRFTETDEWFDRQKGYLDSLESQLRGLVKAIEIAARQRAEIATATGEFSQMVGELASSDVGRQLAQSLAGLADVERKAQDMQAQQSEHDMGTMMATVDEYARLINSVRMAFSSRIRTYHSWRNAESELIRVRQNHERNRAQGKIPNERIGFALNQIAEAERRALEAKHEFENVSKLTKAEVARFEQERISDMRDSLNEFLEGMIARQKQLIGAWETYQQMLLKKVGGGRGNGV